MGIPFPENEVIVTYQYGWGLALGAIFVLITRTADEPERNIRFKSRTSLP